VEAKKGRLNIDHYMFLVPNASLALEEEQDNGQSRHSSVFYSLEVCPNIKSVSGGGEVLHVEAKEGRLSIDHHLSKCRMHLWHWKKSRTMVRVGTLVLSSLWRPGQT
jgi:hypothetical protein